jgi:hypothetical protein
LSYHLPTNTLAPMSILRTFGCHVDAAVTVSANGNTYIKKSSWNWMDDPAPRCPATPRPRGRLSVTTSEMTSITRPSSCQHPSLQSTKLRIHRIDLQTRLLRWAITLRCMYLMQSFVLKLAMCWCDMGAALRLCPVMYRAQVCGISYQP